MSPARLFALALVAALLGLSACGKKGFPSRPGTAPTAGQTASGAVSSPAVPGERSGDEPRSEDLF